MIKKEFYFGFLGLIGFKSLLYFYTGDVSNLSYVAFFSFFSFFSIGRVSGSKEDERYIENRKTALAFIAPLGIIALAIIWSSTVLIRDIDLIRALIFLLSAILINVHGVKLYMLEEK
jgi:hypothetical protein